MAKNAQNKILRDYEYHPRFETTGQGVALYQTFDKIAGGKERSYYLEGAPDREKQLTGADRRNLGKHLAGKRYDVWFDNVRLDHPVGQEEERAARTPPPPRSARTSDDRERSPRSKTPRTTPRQAPPERSQHWVSAPPWATGHICTYADVEEAPSSRTPRGAIRRSSDKSPRAGDTGSERRRKDKEIVEDGLRNRRADLAYDVEVAKQAHKQQGAAQQGSIYMGRKGMTADIADTRSGKKVPKGAYSTDHVSTLVFGHPAPPEPAEGRKHVVYDEDVRRGKRFVPENYNSHDYVGELVFGHSCDYIDHDSIKDFTSDGTHAGFCNYARHRREQKRGLDHCEGNPNMNTQAHMLLRGVEETPEEVLKVDYDFFEDEGYAGRSNSSKDLRYKVNRLNLKDADCRSIYLDHQRDGRSPPWNRNPTEVSSLKIVGPKSGPKAPWGRQARTWFMQKFNDFDDPPAGVLTEDFVPGQEEPRAGRTGGDVFVPNVGGGGPRYRPAGRIRGPGWDGTSKMERGPEPKSLYGGGSANAARSLSPRLFAPPGRPASGAGSGFRTPRF
eukprot:TRINITY_DN110975_c0_g1_i1.p1 TRINITY_DN110975_c0_g1~~TRINITY_DN110975_c0_g1_i1.p1  ORF type:complete len:557 (-),score=100.26 TRINITY_DN110975_c0_g1_i1:41-1711(-)